jgi:hypothetical protein
MFIPASHERETMLPTREFAVCFSPASEGDEIWLKRPEISRDTSGIPARDRFDSAANTSDRISIDHWPEVGQVRSVEGAHPSECVCERNAIHL